MKLKEALIVAADALKNGLVNYEWNKPTHCNCGVVVQVITGKSQRELQDSWNDITGDDPETWSYVAREHCPVTGQPTTELFKALLASGMTVKDIWHLEYLQNPDVLKLCKFPTRGVFGPLKYWEIRANLIEYLRAWASILPDEEADDTLSPLQEQAAQIIREATTQ